MISPRETKLRQIEYEKTFVTLRDMHRKWPTSQEVLNYMAFMMVSDIKEYTEMIVELEKLKLVEKKLQLNINPEHRSI